MSYYCVWFETIIEVCLGKLNLNYIDGNIFESITRATTADNKYFMDFLHDRQKYS